MTGCIEIPVLHHCAKFLGDRSTRCGNIVQFPHLRIGHHADQARVINALVVLFSIFLVSRSSAILYLLNHPRKVLGSFYHCEKFGRNRSGRFDNMPVVVGVGDQTSRDQLMTSGGQLTDDDDALDGGVSLEVFPVVAAAAAAAPVLIASVGNDACDQSPGEVPGHGSGGEADGRPGSPGNYVSGLARSRSDVTSQRRFHRRRSAVRCLAGLAPVSGLSPICFQSLLLSFLAPVSGLSPICFLSLILSILGLFSHLFPVCLQICLRSLLLSFLAPVSGLSSICFRSLLLSILGLFSRLFPVCPPVCFRSLLLSVFGLFSRQFLAHDVSV